MNTSYHVLPLVTILEISDLLVVIFAFLIRETSIESKQAHTSLWYFACQRVVLPFSLHCNPTMDVNSLWKKHVQNLTGKCIEIIMYKFRTISLSGKCSKTWWFPDAHFVRNMSLSGILVIHFFRMWNRTFSGHLPDIWWIFNGHYSSFRTFSRHDLFSGHFLNIMI